MPDISITVCGREFIISCGEGEEQHLLSAAALLDAESKALLSQDERLTEQRMLLMAGLMLADRNTGLQRDLSLEKERVSELQRSVSEFRDAAGPASGPTVSPDVVERLSEMVARAEALAREAETVAETVAGEKTSP
ncbi:MAG: cell division protein ZapA [Rhodobacter sp.]|nr:cell division protein ZapA [Rhodobacter sp.]MCY4166936.1 cell division protein ZapA [Rhodobacter sp.]MCY4240614.1 cell division protein ZapA [Rhodobacter sp.]